MTTESGDKVQRLNLAVAAVVVGRNYVFENLAGKGPQEGNLNFQDTGLCHSNRNVPPISSETRPYSYSQNECG